MPRLSYNSNWLSVYKRNIWLKIIFSTDIVVKENETVNSALVFGKTTSMRKTKNGKHRTKPSQEWKSVCHSGRNLISCCLAKSSEIS